MTIEEFKMKSGPFILTAYKDRGRHMLQLRLDPSKDTMLHCKDSIQSSDWLLSLSSKIADLISQDLFHNIDIMGKEEDHAY